MRFWIQLPIARAQRFLWRQSSPSWLGHRCWRWMAMVRPTVRCECMPDVPTSTATVSERLWSSVVSIYNTSACPCHLPGHVFVHLAAIIIRCTGAAVNLGPTTRLEFNAALTAAQSREDFILTGIAGTESLSVNGRNVTVPSPPSAGFEGQNTSSSSQLLLPSLSSFFSVFRGAGGPACMSK